MMSLKNKLTLLTLVPVVLLSSTLMLTFWMELLASADEQVAATRTNLMELKKSELKNYMELSLSGVHNVSSESSLSKEGAKKQVQRYIQSLKYDDNNYLFAYTEKGERIALGSNLAGVGDNFWDVQDPDGRYVVQGLIEAARDKDGYFLYHWPRRQGQEPLPKLSYTFWLPEYKWMVGTGFYIDDIEREVEAIEAQSSQALTRSLSIGLMVSIGLSGLMVFMIRVAAKRIMGPLEEMNENLQGISSGQGDLTRRLQVKSEDEMGQLANNFNQFVHQIQLIVEQVLRCSTQVKTSAESIDSRNTQIHSLVKNQNTETEMVATAMHQMAASAVEIAGNAENAASVADDADCKSREASLDLRGSVEEVKRLAQDVRGGAEAIQTLEHNVTEITSVLDVIRGIAEQTNLLALNAAIEAARAGELGRGFAVVADEVRTLASRTQDSTEEIQHTIQRLQQAAGSAVEVMNGGLSKSQSTVKKAELAGCGISVIAGEISTITNMISQIATASEEQHQVSEDVNMRVNKVAETSSETEYLSDLCAKDSHQLVDLAEQLAKLMSQFKIA